MEALAANLAHGFYWTEGIKGLGWAANAVPTLKGGSTVGVPSPPAVWLPSGEIVTIGLRDAELLGEERSGRRVDELRVQIGSHGDELTPE